MRKSLNLLYLSCWCCLIWGVIAAIPHAAIQFPTLTFPVGIPRWLVWLITIFVLLLVIFILLTYLKMTPSAAKRIRYLYALLLIGTLYLTGEILYAAFSNFTHYLSFILGCLLVISIASFGIQIARTPKESFRGSLSILWKVTLLTVATIGFTLWFPGMWSIPIPVISLEADLLDYYIGQLSLTFITISVMSVLSDKSVVIYWENVAEAKLIRPLFVSFASYTTYSISATVAAGISVLLNNTLAFLTFFAINIIVIILLTLTMVDVYYNRDRKKHDLAELLSCINRAYRYDDASVPSSYCSVSAKAEYLDIMQNLQYHLQQEIDNHNIPYIREVSELYGGYAECFETAEGKRIKELLYASNSDILTNMVDGIAERINLLTQKHASTNATADGSWNEDAMLWDWLAREENLRFITENSAVSRKMTTIIMNRLTLLVNDILSNSVPMYDSALKKYHHYMKNPARRVSRSMRYLYKFSAADSRSFITNIMTVLTALRKKTDPYIREKINQHLAVVAFRKYIQDPDFVDEIIMCNKIRP